MPLILSPKPLHLLHRHVSVLEEGRFFIRWCSIAYFLRVHHEFLWTSSLTLDDRLQETPATLPFARTLEQMSARMLEQIPAKGLFSAPYSFQSNFWVSWLGIKLRWLGIKLRWLEIKLRWLGIKLGWLELGKLRQDCLAKSAAKRTAPTTINNKKNCLKVNITLHIKRPQPHTPSKSKGSVSISKRGGVNLAAHAPPHVYSVGMVNRDLWTGKLSFWLWVSVFELSYCCLTLGAYPVVSFLWNDEDTTYPSSGRKRKMTLCNVGVWCL